MCIADLAGTVDAVKASSLSRKVAGWKVMPQKALLLIGAFFDDNLTIPLWIKLVHPAVYFCRFLV